MIKCPTGWKAFLTNEDNKVQLIRLILCVWTDDEVAAFTHCDSTSAFNGIEKVKPIKLPQKHPRFRNVLAKLGEVWGVSDDVIAGVEAFTCVIYGWSRVTNIDGLVHSHQRDM